MACRTQLLTANLEKHRLSHGCRLDAAIRLTEEYGDATWQANPSQDVSRTVHA